MSGVSFKQVISFGSYRLDSASGRLLHRSTPVPLRLKAFAVLEYLAMRPGRLVPKEELLDALWPHTHVTPSVLAGCIRELRRSLNDDARASRFIQTVHRRGYRFVAVPVVSEPPLEAAAPPDRVLVLGRDTELVELVRRFTHAVERLRQTVLAEPRLGTSRPAAGFAGGIGRGAAKDETRLPSLGRDERDIVVLVPHPTATRPGTLLLVKLPPSPRDRGR